jgi:serine/threonine protein kinase
MSEESFQGAKYEFGPELGHGGMGAVWRVQDRRLKRPVAMKVMLGKRLRPEDKARFLREAEVLANLEHPNIVPIHELALDADNQPFYTMKLVQGDTLKEVINRLKTGDAETVAKYSLTQLLTIFQKVCDAVAFAHSKGIVHRDLKPENIMLGEYGEVLVMDWGLAKILENGRDALPRVQGEEGNEEGRPAGHPYQEEDGFRELERMPGGESALTMEGQVMGTPQYMAPEQAEGRIADIDGRTDVFSLGGILYSLLTLRPPTGGSTIKEVLENVKSGYIAPATIYNKHRKRAADGSELDAPIELAHCPGQRVPEALSAVCQRAMAVEPEERYQTVEELQDDLRAYQGGFATGAEGAGTLRRFSLWVRRNKTVGISALVIALLATGFMLKVLASERKAQARLDELKQTAPTFLANAQQLLGEQKLTNALERITYATKLDPDQAEYHLLRGHILQALLQMREARDAYAEALRCDAKLTLADDNLKLCEKLLAASKDGKTFPDDSLQTLYDAVKGQPGRVVEANTLLSRLGKRKDADVTRLFESTKAALDKAGIKGNLTKDGEGKLHLFIADNTLSNLAGLAGLSLSELNLGKCPDVADFGPLVGMPLEQLQTYGGKVKTLAPLRGMRLSFFDFLNFDSDIDGLHPLTGMPLAFLRIQLRAGGEGFKDLSPLRGMPLKQLILHNADKLTDLSPLEGLQLTQFSLNHCPATNYAALRGMPLTESVLLMNCGITSLDVFKGKQIVQFGIPGCRAVRDIAPLAGMFSLTQLSIGGTSVTNIAPLVGMRLEVVQLGDTSLKDVAALRGMPLKEVGLGRTPITDLSPLAGAPLTGIGLQETRVQDISPLKGARLVNANFAHSSITNLDALAGMPLEHLQLDGTSIRDLSPLKGMPLIGLQLENCRFLTDISPLLECKNLEYLCLPLGAKDVESLRALPKLKFICYTLKNGWTVTAEDFWRAFDTRDAGKKK